MIILVRLRTRARNITIVQCYAPTNVTDFVAKYIFYSNLSNILTDINGGDIVVLMGDMNAQVGQCWER